MKQSFALSSHQGKNKFMGSLRAYAPVYLFSRGSPDNTLVRKRTFTTSPRNITQNDDLFVQYHKTSIVLNNLLGS
jgi:hypothetical protein